MRSWQYSSNSHLEPLITVSCFWDLIAPLYAPSLFFIIQDLCGNFGGFRSIVSWPLRYEMWLILLKRCLVDGTASDFTKHQDSHHQSKPRLCRRKWYQSQFLLWPFSHAKKVAPYCQWKYFKEVRCGRNRVKKWLDAEKTVWIRKNESEGSSADDDIP